MTKDILKYFPLNSIGETGGLFLTPLSERPWSSNANKSMHGVSYTQFEDAYNIKCSNDETLFDMFHGRCSFYLDYFCKANPGWKAYKLKRDGWNSLVHAFAVKNFPDGRCLFADARGYTDNVLDFFSDFEFSKRTMYLEEYSIKEWDWNKTEFKSIPQAYHAIWDEIKENEKTYEELERE